MKVHLYALCWNDRHMLEYFYRHYEPWVDEFFIFDDGSTDGSLEYIKSRSQTQLGTFHRSHSDSLLLSGKDFSDQIWRQSTGVADWVVITDLDEHLYHPTMRIYLERMSAEGVTAIPALGYQMLTEDLPQPGCVLSQAHTLGAPWRQMSKLSIFRPGEIEAADFAPGRHTVSFAGTVVYPQQDEVINLHYKYLGVSHTHHRHLMQRERLGSIDRANSWGHKYDWSESQLEADFEKLRAALVNVSEIDHHTTHAEPRWWRP
jgi:hypothetical protein